MAAVPDGPCPVRWAGHQAVVTLPEHIGASELRAGPRAAAGPDRPGHRGADRGHDRDVSCEPGGADALLRACQRAAVSGGQLRVAVTAPAVRRILDASGLDRLVSIYPTAQAAIAAGMPGVIPLAPRPGRREGEAPVLPRRSGRAARVTPAVRGDWSTPCTTG